MYIKCRGIVIKQTDSGEKGKMLTILTEKNGVIYAKATGGKNVGAGYFRCCQLFTFSEFHIYTGQTPGALTILDAVYIRSFFNLSADIVKYSLASYVAEIAKISLIGSAEDKEVIRLLLNTFHVIENGDHPYDHIKAVYEIRLGTVLGFEPYLSECDCCGMDLPSEQSLTFFDVENSCVRCENCIKHADSPGPIMHVPAYVYRSMLHVIRSDKDGIFNFKTDEETLKTFAEISEKYILRRLEYEPKSLPLYKSFNLH